MDNIAMLASTIAGVISGSDRLQRGEVSGSQVLVSGVPYNPSWAADIDPLDGTWVYCVISSGRCVVVGVA